MKHIVRGQGPDLVLLHGWSMHSGVWHDLANILSNHFTLHLVDLPGHGMSDWESGNFELEFILDWMAAELPEQACYLGWSLGGMISLAFAERQPKRVDKLVLLAATPCFIQQPSWPNAVPTSTFNHFFELLQQDQVATLQQFLLLQAKGSIRSRKTIKVLASKMAEVGTTVPEALLMGLALLMSMDMRGALSNLTCPCLMLIGDCDNLVPEKMLDDALAINSNLVSHVIDGAGHAPFISHTAECGQTIKVFLGQTDV